MKKGIIILSVVVLIVILLGAGIYMLSNNKNVNLDLTKASTTLMELESENIDRFVAEQKVSELANESINNMMYVYDYEISDSGIDFSLIEEYTIKKNDETKEIFAMIKPVEGKMEEVKTTFTKYAESISGAEKLEVKEIGDYIAFIGTSINSQVFEAAKSAYAPIFSGIQPLEKEGAIQVLGLNGEDVSEAMMLQSMLIVNSTTVVVVKPAEGQEEAVKAKIDEYFMNSEEQWKTYLVDQYEIIKNRKVEEFGDYLIYIATDGQNDKVYETITKSVIEE